MNEPISATPPRPETEPKGGKRARIPIIAIDVPVMFEDKGQEEMGETAPHTESVGILFYGVSAHLSPEQRYQVYSDLNVLYHPIKRRSYISPDIMVVEPFHRLPPTLWSYRIGKHGPAHRLNIEVLSKRSAQQQDLSNKPEILSFLKVPEYILVDVSGEFLPQRLLLKRLQPNGVWRDEQDADGGVTSQLGFRIVIDTDGQVRVTNALTGRRYARPKEAEAEATARHLAVEALAETEARNLAEAAQGREAEARRLAEEAQHREVEARRLAEEAQHREAEARRVAEEAQHREAEARRVAEERVQRMEAELARLRGSPPREG